MTTLQKDILTKLKIRVGDLIKKRKKKKVLKKNSVWICNLEQIG